MPVIHNFLSEVELAYINNLPEVIEAKEKLDDKISGKIYFNIELTETIRNVLATKFGLDFSNVDTIPMRWIKGDTSPHIDSGVSKFKNTHLVYLSDSPGKLNIGDISYDISQNTGYMFNEGILHSTQNTGTIPRLLMGPMNEFAEPVGSPVYYYDSQANAQQGNTTPNSNGWLGQTGDYDVATYGGYTSWMISSSNSTGSSTGVVTMGQTLNSGGSYYLYPYVPSTPTIRRGQTKMSAGDWTRMQRLRGAKSYGHLTGNMAGISTQYPQNSDIHTTPALQQPYNQALHIPPVVGTSKVRRTASSWTDYIASQTGDFVTTSQNVGMDGSAQAGIVRTVTKICTEGPSGLGGGMMMPRMFSSRIGDGPTGPRGPTNAVSPQFDFTKLKF